MPELATAWVTLAVSADGMQRDIRKAFRDIDADGAGRRAGRQFSSNAVAATNLTGIERKIADAGRRGAAALTTVMKAGAAAAGTAVAGTIGTSLKLGFDRLRAIDDAKAKLTGLGHTTQSTAKIMDSALAAVKGTAFGLGDAATIAASAVAAGVKPGRELTEYLTRTADAAAIAGTGLADMGSILNKVRTGQKAYTDDLNMLSDRGVPIYQWIAEEAGVAADEVKKLAEKGKISSQMFEDAITKHIGGAALKMGDSFKGSFDNMKAALGRLGAAAEGPAFERLRVSFNKITGAVDEVTPKVGAFAASLDATMFDEWIPAAQNAWQQLTQLRDNTTVRSTLTELSAVFASLSTTVIRLGPPLAQIGQSFGRASAALGVSSWRLFVTALEAAAGVLNTITPAVETLARLMHDHQGVVTTAAAAWLAFRTIPALLGRITPATTTAAAAVSTLGNKIAAAGTGAATFAGAYRDSVKWMSQANPTVSTTGRILFGAGTGAQTASAHLRVLGINARAAATGGLNMLKTAGTGVIGALGGPFSAALIAAGAAFATITTENQKASQSLQAYQDAVRNTGRAQVDLNEALQRSRGAFDDTVKGPAVDRIRAISTELEAASQRTGSFLDQFRDADHSLWGGFRKQLFSLGDNPDKNFNTAIRRQADSAKDALTAIDALKLSQQSLSDVAYGSQAGFDAMVTKLEAAGGGGRKAATAMRDARRAFLDSQQAAANTAPGVFEMAKAMRTLADDTASAADKSNALKAALDALNPARTTADAQAAHTTAVAAVAQQNENPADAAAGVGDALFQTNGQVNTLLVNGVELNDTLKRLVDTTVDVATKGGDMGATLAQNDEAFANLARRFQTDIPHIKAAFDSLGGPLANAGGQLAGIAKLFQSGAIPTDHPIKVDAPGGKEVFDLLTAMGQKVAEGNDKTIDVQAPLGDSVLQLLQQLGYQARIEDHKLILVKQEGAEDAGRQIDQAARDRTATITIGTAGGLPPSLAPRGTGLGTAGALSGRSWGAIVPMADGGLKHIIKPADAGLYAGRGAGTIFAEKETGGEAYIPLAAAKRGRSTQILSEVARRFGMQITAREDGGITPDALRQFAAGMTGRPDAQSSLVSFITGSTGRTGTDSAALLSQGFQMGDPPKGIAAYWVGWQAGGGAGRTAGTIVDPLTGDVNVDIGGRTGGAAGFPQRAWIALAGDDNTTGGGGQSANPKVVSAANRVTTARHSTAAAQARVDAAQTELDQLSAQGASAKKLDAAEQRRYKAQESLTKALQRQADAEDNLTTVKQKHAAGGGGGDQTGALGQNLGQSLVSGIMQSFGIDGSLFSDPMSWPNVKSAMAGLNWGGNMLKTLIGGGPGTGPGGQIDHGLSGGAEPGPAPAGVVINGNIGMDPRQLTQRLDAHGMPAMRRYTSGSARP